MLRHFELLGVPAMSPDAAAAADVLADGRSEPWGLADWIALAGLAFLCWSFAPLFLRLALGPRYRLQWRSMLRSFFVSIALFVLAIAIDAL